MKSLVILSAFTLVSTCIYAQSGLFDFPDKAPVPYKKPLGRAPQFSFLWQNNRFVTAHQFVDAVKTPENWYRSRSYKPARKELNAILQHIGYERGFDDLNYESVTIEYIPRGAIGNLGFWNQKEKRMQYIYVSLLPEGEGKCGIRAIKITNPSKKFIYLCTICGNAFNLKPKPDSCCHVVQINSVPDVQKLNRKIVDSVRFNVFLYRVHSGRGISNPKIDTLNIIDEKVPLDASVVLPCEVVAETDSRRDTICTNTTVQLKARIRQMPDSPATIRKTIMRYFYDTIPAPCASKTDCTNDWQLSLGGGFSNNTIPRYKESSPHTRTDKAHFAGELTAGRNVTRSLQLGVLLSVLRVSYQDDQAYAGSIANTYNTITVGHLLPISIYAKFIACRSTGFQPHAGVFGGYAFASRQSAKNSNGNGLVLPSGSKGGLTAGGRFGLDYYFTCRFGMGVSVSGQYVQFEVGGSKHHVWIVPVYVVLSYRF